MTREWNNLIASASDEALEELYRSIRYQLEMRKTFAAFARLADSDNEVSGSMDKLYLPKDDYRK